MLHKHITHYTTRIDYNQDLFIYLYMYICMYIFVYQSLPVNGEGGSFTKQQLAVEHKSCYIKRVFIYFNCHLPPIILPTTLGTA